MNKINGMNNIREYLKTASKPIYIYGMGDGAEKMLRYLSDIGVKRAGFFASDGFVRGQVFDGERVMSFSEVAEIHGEGNFIALMAFGSRREDVVEYVCGIAKRCEFYVPELPVTGDTVFTPEFYAEHKAEHEAVRGLLSDELSRQVFDSVIEYRMTGRLDILLSEHMSTPEDEALCLIGADSAESAVDLGAYVGDTLCELVRLQKEKRGILKLKNVRALEPERHSHKKLCLYTEELEKEGVSCIAEKACAADFDGETEFSSGRGRGSKIAKGGEVIRAMKPDTLAADIRPDYIKYDVEGMEYAALVGSKRLIEEYAPALNVALYHRPEDIFALPLLVHGMCPGYRLYIRRHGGIPCWDLNLYAVRS
nr:FkbM family methyltransferase [Clostridia bacterium]